MEDDRMSIAEDVVLPIPPKNPPKKRKKVPKKNKVKQNKRRGLYKPKMIGIADPELTDCIFSDEEVQADFIDQHMPLLNLDEGNCRPTEDAEIVQGHFTATGEVTDSEVSGSLEGSESSVESGRPTSRASSAAGFNSDSSSRPDSALENEMTLSVNSTSNSRSSTPASRPDSAASAKQSPISSIFNILGVMPPLVEINLSELTVEIIDKLLLEFKSKLPKAWIPICDQNSVHLLLLSESTPKAIQREIIINFQGLVTVNIHCENIFSNQVLKKIVIPSLVSDDQKCLELFCEKCVDVVRGVMDFDVCVGANHESTKSVWSCLPETSIDKNPYQEKSYTETCRSQSCLWLVKITKNKTNRCENCNSVLRHLRKRGEFLTGREIHPNTPNIFLTPAQAGQKLKIQHEEIKKKDKKIAHLEKRVKQLLEEEGVDIEDDLSAALKHILSSSQLTDIQKLFLQEQLKCAGAKNPRLHKWHPTMIRLALHMKSKMTASGFEGLRDTGAIKLPCARTLFDYSHAIKTQEGISDGILKSVCEKVQTFAKEYQQYHVLLCDEMYISQNLVYNQSNNSLVGYTHMDEVEKEIVEFEAQVESMFTGTKPPSEQKLAKTILAYMVKGVASNVKSVVAAFPIKDLSAEALYVKTWQVISRCEKASVKILAVVCDGAPTNRAFIKMHQPITKVKNNVIFDTLNFCSPEGRPLFFISDVCHLIKTIRNCLYNSGDKKPRCMEINGEKLQWKTIVRLYLTFKDCNFRKSFKLNAQNVFPNKFSCMNVRNAALVLSDTVAQDIEDQKWPGTAELVKFIRYINKFFDCLNGAFKIQDIRTRNKNLAPFTSADDPRFDWLGVPNPNSQHQPNVQEDDRLKQPFLEYLEQWKSQVTAMAVDPKLKAKRLLAHQTLYGIEMSIRGIAGAIRFLFEKVKEPPKFILGRIFSQDPLEQHFSQQRGACGGSNNPNTAQFLSKQVACTVERDLGVKSRRSNSSEITRKGMKITEEPLEKRKRVPNKKYVSD